MTLPSHIARYDSVDLLDLDQTPFLLVTRPTGATLRAWSKAEEAERRWTMFDWATFVIHDQNRNVSLMTDFASAYLLSFEAGLQVLKEECFSNAGAFEAWLADQPLYDLETRGLRTLRHLEAHIRPGVLSVQPAAAAASRFSGPSIGGTIAWQWEPTTPKDLASLKYPKITVDELPTWNTRSAELLVLGLMRHGLTVLNALLVAAGP